MNKQCFRSFEEDHKQGKKGEHKSHKYLQTLTKNPLFHNNDNFAPWDFENQTTCIEHKDRNCYSNTYTTTMIKELKIDRAEKGDEKRRIWYAFNFLDGLYVIRYNKEKFKKYAVDCRKLEDRPDFVEKEEERIYIPISDLTCLMRIEQKPLFCDD